MPLHDRDYMRDDHRPFKGGRNWSISSFHAVFWLNILVFAVQFGLGKGWVTDAVTGQQLMPMGGVSLRALSQGHVWTMFTYMFVHGSPGHILMNMLMLWFAGKRVYDLFGSRRFLQIYFLSGLFGAAVELAINAYIFKDSTTPLIGASAACMGLLMAFAVAMPNEEITALIYFILPVRMRLWSMARFVFWLNVVLGILGVANVLPSWLSGGAAVAYFAHIGGALTGWYYARSLGYGGNPMTYARQWREEPPQKEPEKVRRPELVRARRKKPVVDVDLDAVHRQNPTRDPVVDLMRDEVDPILDKIMDHGLNSLTDAERRILERASREITRRKVG